MRFVRWTNLIGNLFAHLSSRFVLSRQLRRCWSRWKSASVQLGLCIKIQLYVLQVGRLKTYVLNKWLWILVTFFRHVNVITILQETAPKYSESHWLQLHKYTRRVHRETIQKSRAQNSKNPEIHICCLINHAMRSLDPEYCEIFLNIFTQPWYTC